MRLLLFSFLLIQHSCKDVAFYSGSQDVPAPWAYEEALTFQVEVVDTSSVYSMELLIKHAKDFGYENIYFKVKTDFPTIQDREELLNIELASKAGQWMGKCNSESCKVKVYMLDRFRFPEPGSYSFSFEQYTRDDSLEGMENIDLIITKTNNETN